MKNWDVAIKPVVTKGLNLRLRRTMERDVLGVYHESSMDEQMYFYSQKR